VSNHLSKVMVSVSLLGEEPCQRNASVRVLDQEVDRVGIDVCLQCRVIKINRAKGAAAILIKMYTTTIWGSRQTPDTFSKDLRNIIPTNRQLCIMHPVHKALHPHHKNTMDISQHAGLHCTHRCRRNRGANLHCRLIVRT
jgi:hypothetical protein